MLPAPLLRPVASGRGAPPVPSAPDGTGHPLTWEFVRSPGAAPPVRSGMGNWWHATLPPAAEA